MSLTLATMIFLTIAGSDSECCPAISARRSRPVCHAACHHLDLRRFELFIYSNNHETDELKPSFEEHAVWCDVTKLTDDEAAKKIRVDQVDILLDLSGHTKGNRLGIVARKPAPIQAASFAYPNTTRLVLLITA